MDNDLDLVKTNTQEEAESNIDEFINKRCFIKAGSFVVISDFKEQYFNAYGWVSQKILSRYMRSRGFEVKRVYHRGEQRQCWVGLKIGIRPV